MAKVGDFYSSSKETKLIDNEYTGEKTHAPAMASTQRSLPSVDEEVVGFEDDAHSIIQQLTGGTKELDVVSIVGMPGLGKTTLARKVFNHFIDNRHFDVRALCYISKEYSLMNVFSEILKQVIGNLDNIKEEDIPDKLRKSLMRNRYLIVLDDVWEVKAWEDFRLCFPQDENGSRVVVTTRDEEVARQLKHHSNPYSLRFLTADESWELLRKKVFGEEICPQELLEAGLRVAKNCKGLPLVIVLIAGIIGKQREVSLWHEVANDSSSHALEEQSMKTIESSYDHLEDHLKACLLYMGLFPEDYKIPVSDLLKLWIAENFVQNMDTQNMEEASKICLSGLINRSLVVVIKWRANGEMKYCTLHDVVREFCLRKLIKDKFMQLIVPYNPYQPLYAKEPRLCMYVHDHLVQELVQYEYSLDKIPMLAGLKERESFAQCHDRSLEFIAHPKFYAWNEISLFPLLDNFRLVRVLHLLDIHLEGSWNMAMQGVPYLKYLSIYAKEFDFQWVSHLLDLQSLRVAWKGHSYMPLETSPAAIWKMQKLRHVDIDRFSFTWKDNDIAIFNESVLPNLKTFGRCYVYLADRTPEFWWRFPNIEQLKLVFIEPEEDGDAINFDLEVTPDYTPNLEEIRLQSLQVGFLKMSTNHETVGFGSWFAFPSNLKDLSLHSIFLTEKMVSNIARLPSLERLKLRRIYFNGKYRICWDVSDYKFQALKYLKLQNVHMILWNSSEASFPVLEKLVIHECRLHGIPSSFVDIPTLKLIKLRNCSQNVLDSALDIKKEVEEITGCDSLQVHAQYIHKI